MSDWRMRMSGDAAVTVAFEPRIDPVINARVVALAAGVRAARHRGVRDVVPSYCAVTVYFDPIRTDLDRLWAALEEAALRLVRAELACGPVVDGLMADPLTEGSRLDLLYLVDTMATDLLAVMGRRGTLGRMLGEAPPSSARDALGEHLAGRTGT